MFSFFLIPQSAINALIFYVSAVLCRSASDHYWRAVVQWHDRTRRRRRRPRLQCHRHTATGCHVVPSPGCRWQDGGTRK